MAGGTRATGSPRRTLVVVLAGTLLVGIGLGRFFFLDLGPTEAPPVADPTEQGLAALADARRTADPTAYARAERLIAAGRAARPEDVRAIIAEGLLALARHDFAGALAIADSATAVAPLAVDPLAVRVDALVELGRYDEAAAVVDDMVRRKPNVASLSRASFIAELHGDRAAADALMQQAVASARPGSPDLAYVLALLGDVQLAAGRLDVAASAYARSLATQPSQPQAELGRARVLVARGDLPAAASVLAALTDRIPLPDAVALQADVLAASGDVGGAARQRDLVRAIEALNASAGGVAVDLELARFEAAQIGRPGGDADRAIELAERARLARPTIFADDTLAWALHRSGRSTEALPHAVSAVRTGIGDSTLWWHLAAVQAGVGRDDEARVSLSRAFELRGPLPLLEQPEAAALAARLGVPAPAADD